MASHSNETRGVNGPILAIQPIMNIWAGDENGQTYLEVNVRMDVFVAVL